MPKAVSDKPWSNFSNSDYTDEQYARACVLDRGANAGSAKARYSLPVLEPDGTLNRNGVHAAAAALSGGRGGVTASDSQKTSAAKKLVSYYHQLNEQPPEALTSMAHAEDISAVLEHHGIKGMKWGVRRDRTGGVASPVHVETNVHGQVRRANGGHNQPAHEDAVRTTKARQLAKASGTHALSTKDLQELVNRMNLEQQYSRLSSEKSTVDRGHESVKKVLNLAGTAQQVYNFANSPAGKALRSALAK